MLAWSEDVGRKYGISPELASKSVAWVEGEVFEVEHLAIALWFLSSQTKSIRTLGHLIRTPSVSSFARLVYRWVARRRHWISSKLGVDACSIDR